MVAGRPDAEGRFGFPTTTTAYALCLYDTTGLLATASVPPGRTCAGKPCWTEKTAGFAYKDKTLAADGISQIVLKASTVPGKAKVQVKGRGLPLAMPDLPITTLPLTVQLHNGVGECWQAVNATPTKNDDAQFLGKGQ